MLLGVGILVALVVALWAWQVRLPRTVRWRPHMVDGTRCEIAPDMVLQHVDGETIWASQGYGIYRSSAGGPFRRVTIMRPPAGEAWGGYLRQLRRMFGYQELVEVLPLDNRTLVVFAGGWIHRVDARSGGRTRTGRLRYFGRGKGRGLMAFGLTTDGAGNVWFGEYVTESGDRPVAVWGSRDSGATWTVGYEFPAGSTRHIHAVQHDPVAGGVWIGTGDRDEHCFVGCSADRGTSFEWIAHGTQRQRTCSFLFFDEAVFWAMDADFEQNHLMRWDRATHELSAEAELPDATYYAQRVDASRALLGLAQGVAEVWLARTDGTARRWLGWEVPEEPPARGPSPGVRLARGNVTGGHVYVNPLRTIEHEAAILRFALQELPR